MKKVTVPGIVQRKSGEKIVMVTAYDAPTARILDENAVDLILVGDSLGNVVQGRENTIPVTMEEMVYHTELVARGVQRALVVGDMPFMSYQTSTEDALYNASRFLKEGNASAVKLEVNESYVDTVHALIQAGIPVMGHIGLCPQTIHQMGTYKVQGREAEDAEKLLELAKNIETAGAFSLVLESIPQNLAKEITETINIPTIGIGAGKHCDGQVLVFHDLVGLSEGTYPRFVKKYANIRDEMAKAVLEFGAEVRNASFPGPEHSYD